MKERNNIEKSDIEEIQLLIFNVMGIWFGIDSEQVLSIYELEQAKEQADVVWFHEIISFKKNNVEYSSPKVVLFEDKGRLIEIVIDQLENIMPIKVDDIRLMPQLFEALEGSMPVWAVALRDEKIVLLVDLYKLLESDNAAGKNNSSISA